MSHKYKNIILFCTQHEKSADFTKQLENIKFIRIFHTKDIDEVQQIIDMSDRAVILVDDEIAGNKLFKATLNKKMARFKKYYLHWTLNMPKGAKEKLIEQEFSFINSDEVDVAIDRVELYLFGKSNVFKNPNYSDTEDIDQRPQLKKGYFTHLEKVERSWKTLVSSHEADDEIDEKLGKSWDITLENILSEAMDLQGIREVRLESGPYHELIHPHFIEGKVKRLSIVHINVDDNYAATIMAVHGFLQTLV